MDNPSMSVVARFAELPTNEFRREVESLWEAGKQIIDAVIEQVEEGNIPSLAGLGVIGCTTSQLYGYSAFHGEASYADLVTTLQPHLSSPR